LLLTLGIDWPKQPTLWVLRYDLRMVPNAPRCTSSRASFTIG
jgi:hypothetical protein